MWHTRFWVVLLQGVGERKGDVDRDAQARQGGKEGQASEQGPVHPKDVPAR